jgi:predicted GTPase
MHVYAGVDYEEILRLAEAECDVVLWDGGNNDFPFVRSDLEIVVLDPHRAGHELGYFPGMVNFLRADVLVINKLDSAAPEDVAVLEENVRRERPEATVVRADSALDVEDPQLIRGKRILAVEDGPTVTHGGMKLGAAVVASQRGGAAELVDPRPWLVGTLKKTFEEYPDIGPILPAMGYSDEQVNDLREVIRRADCDAVVVGTPIDLAKLIEMDKPNTRVRYTIEERGTPTLADVVDRFLEQTTSS